MPGKKAKHRKGSREKDIREHGKQKDCAQSGGGRGSRDCPGSKHHYRREGVRQPPFKAVQWHRRWLNASQARESGTYTF